MQLGRRRSTSGHFVRNGGLERINGGSRCIVPATDVSKPPKTICEGEVHFVNDSTKNVYAAPWIVKVTADKFELQEIVGDEIFVPYRGGDDEPIIRYKRLSASQFFDPDLRIYVVYGLTEDEVRPNLITKQLPKSNPAQSLRVWLGRVGESVTANVVPTTPGLLIPTYQPPRPPKPRYILQSPPSTTTTTTTPTRPGSPPLPPNPPRTKAAVPVPPPLPSPFAANQNQQPPPSNHVFPEGFVASPNAAPVPYRPKPAANGGTIRTGGSSFRRRPAVIGRLF